MFYKFLDNEILEDKEEFLKAFAESKENELREFENALNLKRFSTKELKAEIKRRKKER